MWACVSGRATELSKYVENQGCFRSGLCTLGKTQSLDPKQSGGYIVHRMSDIDGSFTFYNALI